MKYINAWLVAILVTVAGVAPAHAQTYTCQPLTYTMYRGVYDYQVGGDVTRLQRFLASEGIFNYSDISGYYGRLTEHAVKRFQAGRGIVSYGTPYSTGFGVAGRTTRATINSLCGTTGGVTIPQQCPVIPITMIGCAYGTQTPVYDARGCITQYTCTQGTTGSRAPVLNSFSGPTRLRTGETGTWSVSAHDPDGGILSYSLSWGDISSALAASSYQVNQQSTFTHNYALPGTYTVVITVTDQQGLTAQATATVVVDYTGTSSDLRVVSPNGGNTLTSGSTTPIAWQDFSTSYQVNGYDIRLVSYTTPCTQTVCPLNPTYAYSIASNFYGTQYNWYIPATIPVGSYQIQVCRTGTQICDVSDSQFTINGGAGNTNTSLTLSPTLGGVPMTTTASIAVTIPSGTVTPCGTLTLGTLDWGDGANETVTYMGCTSYQTITRTHTYTTAGTYQVRVYDTNSTLLSSGYVTANTTAGNLTNVTVNRTTVARGESIIVSWAFASTWSDARIRIELREANGTGVGESGIVTGLAAQSGSYTWTVPTDSGSCVADAGTLCSAQIVSGRQYIARVIVYTPVNYCWGYCQQVSGAQILATRDSSPFSITGTTTGTGSFTAVLSATSDGYAGYPYMVNISARTPTYGTQCSVPSSLVLDYGDGQTATIATPSSGTTTCGYQYTNFVHYYSTPGTYTLTVKNAAYPYDVVTTQSTYVY